ncbi:MAG: hypothetical protein LBC77_04010 [Spirochaetaceae bacterium]|jgi:hypothetical protein|nr:hypothetical protein [Spirochaetaceae bacterium]
MTGVKKIGWAAFFLLLCNTAPLFPQLDIVESWTSVGISFENLIEETPAGDTGYVFAPGTNIAITSFAGKGNAGFFMNFSFAHPAVSAAGAADYKYLPFYDFFMGPAFRKAIRENLTFHGGIGIDAAARFAGYTEAGEDYAWHSINLGLGAVTALKLDINDRIYLDFGLAVTSPFFFVESLFKWSSDGNVRTTIKSENLDAKLSIGVRPYICLGFNYYVEKGIYGKPR